VGGIVVEKQTEAQIIGRATATEFALATIIKALPTDVREAVHNELKTFMQRSIEQSHEFAQAVADATECILKDSVP
jgi:hypothetical protein